MASISEFEYTKDWRDHDDFPTRETSESQVREDIQLLFDELKSYINDTVVAAINNHETRIAALGGGGTVTHDILGDDSVQNNNIQDGAITSDKFDDEVNEYMNELIENGITNLTSDSGDYYDDLADAVKAIVKNMSMSRSNDEWGVYPVE